MTERSRSPKNITRIFLAEARLYLVCHRKNRLGRPGCSRMLCLPLDAQTSIFRSEQFIFVIVLLKTELFI